MSIDKENKYYKICQVWSEEDGSEKYTSLSFVNSLDYAIGKKTIPEIGKLFLYTNKYMATISMEENTVLFEGSAEDVQLVQDGSFGYYAARDGNYACFWEIIGQCKGYAEVEGAFFEAMSVNEILFSVCQFRGFSRYVRFAHAFIPEKIVARKDAVLSY